MMVNGVWIDNISCTRCGHRHPKCLSCEAARDIAERARPETIPCKYCGIPTRMAGTKMCDNCYEVACRVRYMPVDVLNRILHGERS